MPAAERVIDVSEAAAHISLRCEQLVIRTEAAAEVTIPLAEIAVLVLASPRSTATQPALAGITRHGGAVIVCDDLRQPAGMMLPLSANATQTQRMLAQIRSPLPTTKRLWKQIVQEKIRAQAGALMAAGRGDGGLRALAGRVRSGDPENLEGQAAQRYWPLLFNDAGFRRRRDADDQNRFLNYGYAVLRGAVARAACASGLHPSIGLHHHGRGNPWCLADDLMEPYRPLVDRVVVELVGEFGGDGPMDRPVKARLASVLSERVSSGGECRTASDWIARTTASLSQVFMGEAVRLFYPEGLRDGNLAS